MAGFKTTELAMMTGENGAVIDALFTNGETLPDGGLGYQPLGLLDGKTLTCAIRGRF